MARNQRPTMRKPATRFAQLAKKLRKQKTEAHVYRGGKKG